MKLKLKLIGVLRVHKKILNLFIVYNTLKLQVLLIIRLKMKSNLNTF